MVVWKPVFSNVIYQSLVGRGCLFSPYDLVEHVVSPDGFEHSAVVFNVFDDFNLAEEVQVLSAQNSH